MKMDLRLLLVSLTPLGLALAGLGCSTTDSTVNPILGQAVSGVAAGDPGTMHIKWANAFMGTANKGGKQRPEHGEVAIHDWQGNPVLDAVVTVEFSGCSRRPRATQATAVSDTTIAEEPDVGIAFLTGDTLRNDRYRYDHAMQVVSVEHPTLTYDPSANDGPDSVSGRPCGF